MPIKPTSSKVNQVEASFERLPRDRNLEIGYRPYYGKTSLIDQIITEGIKVCLENFLSECIIQASHRFRSRASSPDLSESSLALWADDRRPNLLACLNHEV